MNNICASKTLKKDDDMVFSSAIFLLCYFPIVFIINYLIKEKYSNILLLIASLVFYAWGEPVCFFLMIAVILLNWKLGIWIEKKHKKKLILTIAILFDLSILIYFKYVSWLVYIVKSIFNLEWISCPNISLPIGISFFIFQAISYVIDIYRGEAEASSNFVNTALYISFFPQLIAGPIVKYRDINKQIHNRKMDGTKIYLGFKRFIYGLAKKVLIANVLGLCVDTIFANDIINIGTKTAWIGALAYTFQIYYDFSGYSDMAIGLGKMFGFDILENFNYPYLSKSISEFWRRWHISLGTWFKEYVYIPIGGNRKGRIRTYINLGIVFLLTGLWHGADFSFVFWGLYHGFFQIIERLGAKKILEKSKVISILYCFLVVNFGWVIFRADSFWFGLRYIQRMILPFLYFAHDMPVWYYLDQKTIFVGICAFIGAGVLTFIPDVIKEKWRGSICESLYCVFLLTLCFVSIASNTYNPFIYYQF